MPISVRLDPKIERVLNALAKRRRQSRSDVVREALGHYAAADQTGVRGVGPYDLWTDVIGIISVGVRDPRRTTGEQFAEAARRTRHAPAAPLGRGSRGRRSLA